MNNHHLLHDLNNNAPVVTNPADMHVRQGLSVVSDLLPDASPQDVINEVNQLADVGNLSDAMQLRDDALSILVADEVALRALNRKLERARLLNKNNPNQNFADWRHQFGE